MYGSREAIVKMQAVEAGPRGRNNTGEAKRRIIRRIGTNGEAAYKSSSPSVRAVTIADVVAVLTIVAITAYASLRIALLY